MCLATRDSQGEFNPNKALIGHSICKLEKHASPIFIQFSFDAYMPTLPKNIKDFLASTYELCEDG